MTRTLLLAALGLISPAIAQQPIDAALRQHALFRRPQLEEAPACLPFRLWIQPPRGASGDPVTTVGTLYSPWLAKLGEVFEAEYVTPNNLGRREARQHGVVIVTGVPTFRNAKRYESAPDPRSEQCIRIDDLGAIVGLWTERMPEEALRETRRLVLERAVEELLASHASDRGRLPTERWAVEGIAGYLAGPSTVGEPADLAHPPADPGALERTQAWLEAGGPSMLMPLHELAGASSKNARLVLAARCSKAAGVTLTREQIPQLFRDQATLWVHFLQRGEGGRHRAAWRRYVAKVLAGNGSPEELAATLGLEPASLQGAFEAHLRIAGTTTASPGAALPPSAGAGPLVIPGLVPVVEDADGHLAEALGRAGRGDYEGASSYLEAARAMEATLQGRERLSEEQERLSVLLETRDRFLASLAGAERKLRIDTGEEKVVARVEAYAGGVLRLRENKAGIETLAARELRPRDLARSMGSAAADHGPDWIVPYLGLLAGDRRWDRKLDASQGPGQALAAAAQGGLEELVKEGAARATLGAMAYALHPSGAEEIEERLQALARLAADHADTRALELAREGVRIHAEELLGVLHDTRDLADRLHGKVEEGEQGRVRLIYEFDDPLEKEDFRPIEGLLADRLAKMPELGNVQTTPWSVRSGNLEGAGTVAVQHVIAFEAPLTVRYELLYGRGRVDSPVSFVLMGTCSDGQGAYVGAWDLFDLEAIDLARGYARMAPREDERLILPARTYYMKLDHDGRRAHLWVDDVKRKEVETGPVKRGCLLLWAHSNTTIALRRIEIEGRLAPGGASQARQTWVSEELERLGL